MTGYKKSYFSKGDPVPQWVESTENVDLFFGTDVEVHCHTGGRVCVYPISRGDGDFVLMEGRARDDNQPTRIVGAPTNLLGYPYGSPKNEVKFIDIPSVSSATSA